MSALALLFLARSGAALAHPQSMELVDSAPCSNSSQVSLQQWPHVEAEILRQFSVLLLSIAATDQRISLPHGFPKFSHRFESAYLAATDVEDLNKLTVPVLKENLRSHGLTVSGKKAELVARLNKHFNDDGDDTNLAVEPNSAISQHRPDDHALRAEQNVVSEPIWRKSVWDIGNDQADVLQLNRSRWLREDNRADRSVPYDSQILQGLPATNVWRAKGILQTLKNRYGEGTAARMLAKQPDLARVPVNKVNEAHKHLCDAYGEQNALIMARGDPTCLMYPIRVYNHLRMLRKELGEDAATDVALSYPSILSMGRQTETIGKALNKMVLAIGVQAAAEVIKDDPLVLVRPQYLGNFQVLARVFGKQAALELVFQYTDLMGDRPSSRFRPTLEQFFTRDDTRLILSTEGVFLPDRRFDEAVQGICEMFGKKRALEIGFQNITFLSANPLVVGKSLKTFQEVLGEAGAAELVERNLYHLLLPSERILAFSSEVREIIDSAEVVEMILNWPTIVLLNPLAIQTSIRQLRTNLGEEEARNMILRLPAVLGSTGVSFLATKFDSVSILKMCEGEPNLLRSDRRKIQQSLEVMENKLDEVELIRTLERKPFLLLKHDTFIKNWLDRAAGKVIEGPMGGFRKPPDEKYAFIGPHRKNSVSRPKRVEEDVEFWFNSELSAENKLNRTFSTRDRPKRTPARSEGTGRYPSRDYARTQHT